MASKFRIAIIGIGGVGGYLGGKLAAKYAGSPDTEIIFIARGENANAIRLNGLKLLSGQGEEIAYPSIVTDQPGILGVVDLIICCVKSYDLETSLTPFKNCISDKIIIIPFLNGLDAADNIKKILPGIHVLEGCAYIISRLIAPGVVKEGGNPPQFYFGAGDKKENAERVAAIFTAADINAHVSDNISVTLWEKFLFISPFATIMSCYDVCLGDILKNPDYKGTLVALMTELKAVADAKGILLPEDIIQKFLDRMAALPYESTTSMHTDFKNGKKTELNSLTVYVITLGKELNIPTPNYEKMLQGINERWLTKV
jgi:2-dehydropantoate 2-reductase